MKLPFFIFALVALSFLSCGGKDGKEAAVAPPPDIVSPEEMKDVMIDILLAEGATGVSELKFSNPRYMTRHYYTYVLKKHNMTNKQFSTNFSYYAGHSEKMEKLVTDVINDLSEKQGTIRREE